MPIKNERDAVMHSAACHIPKLYFVGPFGARVSFASQQRRAINLIWALIHNGVIPKDEEVDVAIIGGGIAGVTAAAALLARKCNVWIYEKEGEVLGLQKNAHHRVIHPTINFWPEEELSLTTDLPFFDWYADSCDSVLKVIGREWNQWFATKVSDVFLNTTVTGFEYDPVDKKVVTQVETLKKPREHRRFDIVLVTTGFGLERNMKDRSQKSYWDQDKVDAWALTKKPRYAVSGIGDGGIIDTLRLTYPGFMKDQIALKYLQRIDRKLLRDKLIGIEKAAEEIDDPNERAEFYDREYRKVADGRSLEAKAFLPPLPEGKAKVTLIGRLVRPFEISAAPIHRLILAHSLNEGRVNYLRGKVTRERGQYFITDEETDVTSKLDFDEVVIRHGSDKPVVSFLGDVAAEKMEDEQRLIGDYLALKGFSRSFYNNAALYPERGAGSFDFVDLRRDLAEEMMTPFGLAVSIDSSNPKRLRFQTTHKDAERKVEPEIRLPTKIFSIDLIPPTDAVVEASTLVGRARR
jgi:hypothetical protein